jgi:arginase
VGSAVLEAVLPPHDGPSATVPVTMSDAGLEERGGVEAKTVILEQLAAALEIRRARPGADHDARGRVLGERGAILRTRSSVR